ncbi:MAG: putative metal-binding motif-containing protein [Deltaproteobacteria bacterium]|nr:putative metal-binding motif-containing protein [Deltaproteobacteria bacterium]
MSRGRTSILRGVPLSPFVALCVGSALGCEADGYGLALHLYADAAADLGEGSAVVVQMKDLQSREGGTRVGILLEQDIGPADPLDVDVPLNGGGYYHVHVVATSPAGRFVATRCYHIGGEYDSEVLLVGPLGDDEDRDGDSWPAEENCRERGSSEVGCTDQCPTVRAADCNEGESDLNPGAPEVCDDHIDQDCNSVDAICDGEDEG